MNIRAAVIPAFNEARSIPTVVQGVRDAVGPIIAVGRGQRMARRKWRRRVSENRTDA